MRRETLPCAAAPCCALGRVLLFGLPCCAVAVLWFVAEVGSTSRDGWDTTAAVDNDVLVLHDAARCGSLAAVDQVLAREPSVVNEPEPGGQFTPLMVAARFGHVGVAERLIAAGADVHAAADGHGTALSIAAWNNHPKVVRVLLAAGADPNTRTATGHTPLMFAARNCDDEVVALDLLLRAGARPDTTDAKGETAFTFATASENTRTARRLRTADWRSDEGTREESFATR